MNIFKKFKSIFKRKSKNKDFKAFDDDLNLVKKGMEENDLKYFIQPYNIPTGDDISFRGEFPFTGDL